MGFGHFHHSIHSSTCCGTSGMFGHKTATSTFYGYKNHIAMTDERLIAGISVTHGEAPDGPELPGLIEKAQKNGINRTDIFNRFSPSRKSLLIGKC